MKIIIEKIQKENEEIKKNNMTLSKYSMNLFEKIEPNLNEIVFLNSCFMKLYF